MTIRLTVDTPRWEAHVNDIVGATPGLVPVVKGNGYGFGRAALARRAATLSDTIAIGTVHELSGLDLSDDAAPGVVVLTPTLTPPDTDSVILTVGSIEHLDALAGWRGRVIVKLLSPMRRYGGDVSLAADARARGFDVAGVSLHLPLAGSAKEHGEFVESVLPMLDPSLTVWLSHLEPAAYAGLPTTHRYRLRLGTSLWHGDKSMLHLEADVLDSRVVRSGDPAGYQQARTADNGTMVMIGAGTANGIRLLERGLSPFHFEQRRLTLHEPPHMHTSMAFVPAAEPSPGVGDWVDVQQPLITTTVDEFRWN